MNWTATVNEHVVDQRIPFRADGRHEFLSETCQYVGKCAIMESAATLADGIEHWLKSVDFWEHIRITCDNLRTLPPWMRGE